MEEQNRTPSKGREAGASQDMPTFAVYCDANKSLCFYRREEIPRKGDTVNGLPVDKVYKVYLNQELPRRSWNYHAEDIEAVEVVDEGIAPASTAGWFSGLSNMTSCDLSKLDTSRATNMSGMFAGCKSLKSLALTGFDTSNVVNMDYMFCNCRALESLDLSSFNTTSVVTMGQMFENCKSLKSLDLTCFDTGSVEYMRHMFRNCESLTDLDLSGFDTGRARSMTAMFQGCSSLAALNLSGFDTENVLDMDVMFESCSSLKSLYLTSFDTSRVEGMFGMFASCKSLESLDLSSFDTSRVQRMYGMFNGCSSLSKLDFSNVDASSVRSADEMFAGCDSLPAENVRAIEAKIAGIEAPRPIMASQEKQAFAVYSMGDKSLRFYKRKKIPQVGKEFYGRTADAVYSGDEFAEHRWSDRAPEIKTVKVIDAGIAPASTADWFSGCVNMASAALSKLDTGDVRDMSRMFNGCSSLKELDLSSFETSRVTSMDAMFEDCSSLTSLDLSGFETSRVENMSEMFRRCSSLESLDLAGFDTARVETMHGMFAGCSSLIDLDPSGFDTSNVENMGLMFSQCKLLKKLNLSGFDTSRVITMYRMFNECKSLASLNLSGFDAGNVNSMNSMFNGCKSLTDLDFSIIASARVVTMMDDMLDSSLSLPVETMRAIKDRIAADQVPLYRESQGARTLDSSIAALERRAQGFPGEKAIWVMRRANGGLYEAASFDLLLDGADVLSIDEVAGGLTVTIVPGFNPLTAEIRLSASDHADWEECEPPHVALWAAGSGEPMQWAVGACPSEAELLSAKPDVRVRAVAAAEPDGTWSATVVDAGREIVRTAGLSKADDARHICEMGAFRLGGAVCADSAAQFAEVSAKAEAAAAGTLSAFASAPGIDGEALLADWARESRGADPEKAAVPDAVEALGPLSAYARENPRPAVQNAGRTVEAMRAGAAQAGILRAEALGAARAASVDAAVSMMAKGADGFAVVYRDLAFAPAADGTWTVMKQSAEGSFSPFETGWRPGILSFDEQAAAADVAKMEAATPAECNAGGWRDAGSRAAESPAKAAPSKRAQAPAKADPALLADAGALGSSSRGAR